MRTVVSKDGTTIAFSKVGKGPALLLVDCALYYRQFRGGEALAAQLAAAFTVYTYDRRGRGESGDTLPYAVAREIEDIAALIEEAGGPVFLYGSSSGAALALQAAAHLGPARIAKLALYEPPFDLGEAAAQAFVSYTQRMVELLAANQRSEAVAFFMADMMPPEVLARMRQSPEWPRMEVVAHTLAYDNAVLGNGAVPTSVAQSVTMPALVLDAKPVWISCGRRWMNWRGRCRTHNAKPWLVRLMHPNRKRSHPCWRRFSRPTRPYRHTRSGFGLNETSGADRNLYKPKTKPKKEKNDANLRCYHLPFVPWYGFPASFHRSCRRRWQRLGTLVGCRISEFTMKSKETENGECNRIKLESIRAIATPAVTHLRCRVVK